MRFDDPIDHYEWGEKLVEKRSPDGFQTYGAQMGVLELAKAWNHFMFARDARQLALIPKKITELAAETFDHNLSDGLKLNHKIWNWDDPARTISTREHNAWLNGFIGAYRESLDENISRLIPRQLENHLPLFCDLVGAIAQDGEEGHDLSDWGVRLGAKKTEPPAKIHPQRAAIIKRGKADGLYDAKLNWGWQTTGNTSIRRPMISPPYEWELSTQEEALYADAFEEAFMDYVRTQVQKIAPPQAWKNAFLICSLFDEIQVQKYGNRRAGGDKRWQYLRYLRERDLARTEVQKKQEEAAFQKRYYRQREEPAVAGMGSATLGAFISRSVRMTSGAQKAFEETGDNPEKFLDRHFSEDFGESPKADLEMNRQGAKTGGMVMSIYSLSNRTKIWIITDDGHEMTTILLPEEY